MHGPWACNSRPRPAALAAAALLGFAVAGATAAAPAGGLHSAAGNIVLLAAAAPFEDLVDYALARDAKGMGTALSAYEKQAGRVGRVLSTRDEKRLEGLVTAIRRDQHRGRYQQAAVESADAYGTLINALDATVLRVPVQVSLLDYAGMKEEALLDTKSPDWQAVDHTSRDAAQYWNALSPLVKRPDLRDAVNTVLTGMKRAGRLHNPDMGLLAARTDQDLVDILEHYFTSATPR